MTSNSGAWTSVLASVLCLMALACEPTVEVPTASVTAVVPTTLPAGALATFTVRGENFLPGATLDLDDGSLAAPPDSTVFTVSLGQVELVEVLWVDAGTLTATLDQGLPVGPHALEVVTPGGDHLRLEGALQVVDATRPTVEIIDPSSGAVIHPGESISIRVRAQDDEGLAALELGSCRTALGTECTPVTPERRTVPGALTQREERFDLIVPAAASDGDLLIIEAHAEDLPGQRSTARIRLPVVVAAVATAISPTEGGEAGGTVRSGRGACC